MKACENLRIELKLDWEKWGCSAGINAKSVAFQGAESAASGKVMLWLLRSFQGINDTRSEDRNDATLLDFCARPDPVQHLEVSTCAYWQIGSLMKSIVFLSISASSSFSLGEICAKVRFSTPRFASIKYDVTLFTYDVPLLWRPQNVQQGIHDYPIKPSKSLLYRLMLTWVCYIDWPKTMIVHFLPTTVTAYFMARRCVTVDGGDQTVH